MHTKGGPQVPGAIRAGGLALVLPAAGGRLTSRNWTDFGCALILDAAGEAVLAASMVTDLEKRLGVNDAHRRAAATSPAAVVASIAAATRRRRDAEVARIAALDAPLRDPEIVAELAELARKAHERRAEAESLRILDAKKNRRKIKMLEAQAKQFDGEADLLRKKEAEQDLLCGEAREPFIRAKLRGEEVSAAEVEVAEVVTDEYGARVIHRRGQHRGLPQLRYSRQTRAQKLTGIMHAYVNGHLEGRGPRQADVLLETGQAYAEAYEIDEGNRSNAGGEGGGGFGPKGPQVRVVEAAEALAVMRRWLTPRERQVLDLVCGEGLRAREAADLMRAGFPSTKRALCGGLKAATENMRAARAARELGHAAQRVQEAHAVLRGIRL